MGRGMQRASRRSTLTVGVNGEKGRVGRDETRRARGKAGENGGRELLWGMGVMGWRTGGIKVQELRRIDNLPA